MFPHCSHSALFRARKPGRRTGSSNYRRWRFIQSILASPLRSPPIPSCLVRAAVASFGSPAVTWYLDGCSHSVPTQEWHHRRYCPSRPPPSPGGRPEALDIPHAATVGDEERRTAILVERAGHAVVMLRAILHEQHPAPDIAWSVAYLRDRLAEHPSVGYKTCEARLAELDAAKDGGGR